MAEVAERPKPSTAREVVRRVLAHENAVIGIALAAIIAVLAGISRGATVTRGNMANVLIQSSVRGVAAVGQAFCILTANFDLSVSGVGVMAMMLGSSMMTMEWRNILGYPASPFMAIPAMLAVGACWGLLSGALVSRLNMPSLIVTFGVWQIGYGVAYYVTEGTAIMELPESFAVYGALPVGPIIFFSVAALAYFVLTYTSFGRRVYAAGGSPVSAYLSGINVKNTYLVVFAISGLCAGLAGMLMTSRGMAGTIEALRGLELDSIASVVIGGVSLFGGRGNMIGVVLGALLIGVINNAMSVLHMGHAGRYIVKGAIIIGAVAADILRRRGR
ncbi:MAG: ABC transporter permease [Dehalococcoidia bacterium]|nr:MAG: ABC transporter permease [Dehalococcoidia bacterium]